MKQLSAAAVERAMKLQDVMLRTMAKRITWFRQRRSSALVAGRCSFALAQLFEITKWRIDGQEVPTISSVSIHFGQLPCISTFFQFETVEKFYSVRRVLEDIGLCKLNEKYRKPIRTKKK